MAIYSHGTRLLLVILFAKIAKSIHYNHHNDNLDSEFDAWGFGGDDADSGEYGHHNSHQNWSHGHNGRGQVFSGVGDVSAEAPVEKREFRHLEDLKHLYPVHKHHHGKEEVHEHTVHVPIRRANAKHLHSSGGVASGDFFAQDHDDLNDVGDGDGDGDGDDWDLGLFGDDEDNGGHHHSHGRGHKPREEFHEHVDNPQDDFSLWHAFGDDQEFLGDDNDDDDDEIGNVHFNHGRNQLHPYGPEHEQDLGETEDYDYGDFDIFDALPSDYREYQLQDVDNAKGGNVDESHHVTTPQHPLNQTDDDDDDVVVALDNQDESGSEGLIGLDDLSEDLNGNFDESFPFETAAADDYEANEGTEDVEGVTNDDGADDEDTGVLKVHDNTHHGKKSHAKGPSKELLESDELFKELIKQGGKHQGAVDLNEAQEPEDVPVVVEKNAEEDVPEQEQQGAKEDDENDSAFITDKGIFDDSSFDRNTRHRLSERLEKLEDPKPKEDDDWEKVLTDIAKEHGGKVVGDISDAVAKRIAGRHGHKERSGGSRALEHHAEDEDEDEDGEDEYDGHSGSIDGPVSVKWHKGKREHSKSKHNVKSKTTHEDIKQIGNDNLNSNNSDLSIALRYLGAGYDIIFGNPLGDPSIMVDPGYRNPVIKLNWNYEYLNDDGANLKEPKGSWVRPELSCRQAESVIQINTVDDYKKELSVDAQISTNIPFYFSFSGSTGYRNFVKTSSKKNSRTYILKTYCLRYVAGISDYKNMGTTREFKEAVENLPTEFDVTQCPIEKFTTGEGNGVCREQIRPWMQFFRDFGTHFTTIIHLGGKVTNQFTVNKSDIENIQHSGLNMDAVLKANVGIPFATLGGGVASSSETQAKSASDQLNSEKLVIVIGGDTQADVQDKKSMSEWTASLSHKPMPIKVRLESIRILIKDPDRQFVFDKALKYYSEVYGIPPGEIYRVNGEATGVASLTHDATPVTFSGLGSGSAVCPPKTSIIMGFSLVYRKRQGNFLNLKENEFDLDMYTCPVGEEKCSVSADQPDVETRIWILCSANPIPLLTQHAVVENGQAATAQCENGYSIAYGFGFSIPRGLDAQPFDTYACRSGQRTCYHTSQKKTTPNGVWIACVEDNAPELSKITNHVVSVSNRVCTDKNKSTDFKNNYCPPNSKPITGWEMYLSETKKDQMKRFTSCPKYSHGCHIDPGLSNEHERCRAFYSWLSCVAN